MGQHGAKNHIEVQLNNHWTCAAIKWSSYTCSTYHAHPDIGKGANSPLLRWCTLVFVLKIMVLITCDAWTQYLDDSSGSMYVCMHVCMYVCMSVYTYACMRVLVNVCIHVCIYVKADFAFYWQFLWELYVHRTNTLWICVSWSQRSLAFSVLARPNTK